MLGPVNDRHTSVLQGNTNKAAGIFWNGRITARMKTEEKQDARLKASQDTDIVQRCRQALSRWNEKVMCVCLCAGWGLGGRRGSGGGAAVSNGSCLTGKRSICYNVNNDPSSYCAARDKSIKDPSRPIIASLCQQPAEGTRVTEREKSGEEYWRHSYFFRAALQNSCSYCEIKCWFAAVAQPFLSLCSILSGTHMLVICYGRFAAQWNLSGSGAISLLPHWLPINKAILANTFWQLWNYFWSGVFGHKIHKRLVSFKVNPSRRGEQCLQCCIHGIIATDINLICQGQRLFG